MRTLALLGVIACILAVIFSYRDSIGDRIRHISGHQSRALSTPVPGLPEMMTNVYKEKPPTPVIKLEHTGQTLTKAGAATEEKPSLP